MVGADGSWDLGCYGNRGAPVSVDLRTPGGAGEPGENDTLASIDQVVGTPSGDTIVAGASPLLALGLGGDDTLAAGPAPATLLGGDGDDRILGGPSRDELTGDAGADTIDAGGDADHAEGGDGDDDLSGAAGDDDVRGGDGNDRVQGGDGADTLHGNHGDDWVEGGANEDLLVADEAGPVFNHSPLISIVHEDQLWCGAAPDIALADYADAVGGDCEMAVEGTPKWRKVRVGKSGRFTLGARCAWLVASPCTGVLRVTGATPPPAPAPRRAEAPAGAQLAPPRECRSLRPTRGAHALQPPGRPGRVHPHAPELREAQGCASAGACP